MKKYPTQDRLRELFDYHLDGYLIWKTHQGNHVTLGTIAGRNKTGRSSQTGIDGYRYSTHCLIFIYLRGWHPDQIDHQDRNAQNNKIENLRPCTRTLNNFNTKRKSRYRGAYKVRNKWRAVITFEGKHKHLGYFDDAKSAHATYCSAAKKLAGEFFCSP